MKQNTVYVQLARADLLWQLGRPSDAKAVLESIPGEIRDRSTIGASIALINANVLASQGESRDALLVSQSASLKFPKNEIGPQLASALLRTSVTNEIQLGQMSSAKEHVALLPSPADAPDAWENAENELTRALLSLHTEDPSQAREHAQFAETFFAQKGIAESDALSLLVEAEASEALRDQPIADKLSKKSVDIFRSLEQSWGVPAFRQYLTRFDRQQTFRALRKLRAAHGENLNEFLGQGS